jgi:hypothetical protein
MSPTPGIVSVRSNASAVPSFSVSSPEPLIEFPAASTSSSRCAERMLAVPSSRKAASPGAWGGGGGGGGGGAGSCLVG